MHTKGNAETRRGPWTRRIGALVLGASLGWSVIGSSGAAAETCALVIVTACEDSKEPPPSTTTTTAPAPPAPAPPLTSAQAAARLLTLLNDERARAGVGPSVMRGDVTEIAVGWSATMARTAHLAHNDEYFTKETRTRLDARLLGENVARNPSVDGAHHALMASAPHRANMLDARFVVVGIAAELRDGSWWVTQDFLQPAGAGAAPTSADTAPGPAPAQVAPSTAPDSSGSPAPQPNRSDPSTAPAAGIDEGEVLAATASEPAVVQLSPSATAEAGRAITTAGRAITSAVPSATSSRVPAVAAAAALLVLALLAAYRMSCVSASARIRCR